MKPPILPTFATDPVLTGGAQLGQVTRLQPGDALRAQGFYMDRRVPARIFSWLFGAIGDWLQYFAPAQIKNWKLEGSLFLGATTNHADMIWLPEGYENPPSGQWYV
ncbi:MAG TPA: hypothetical protein VHW01_23585, partial [Polyangiaceae bacterium]|nr:hypothetical protein [Polyangiaceae bacterium]